MQLLKTNQYLEGRWEPKKNAPALWKRKDRIERKRWVKVGGRQEKKKKNVKAISMISKIRERRKQGFESRHYTEKEAV